jgi:hypothetical protein
MKKMYLFLVDDWEHFSGGEDSIDFEKTLVEVFAFVNGFFVIVSLRYLYIEGFVEAVDFIFDWSAKCIHFGFSEPVTVHVAFSLVFDEVLQLICTLPNSSP